MPSFMDKVRWFLPAQIVKGRLEHGITGLTPQLPGTSNAIMPDNRPTLGQQLTTCQFCRNFERRDAEWFAQNRILEFLTKEAALLPDPNKGHNKPPPGYEAFLISEGGTCKAYPGRLTQLRGTCHDGWAPNIEALSNFVGWKAAVRAEDQRRAKAAVADRERERDTLRQRLLSKFGLNPNVR